MLKRWGERVAIVLRFSGIYFNNDNVTQKKSEISARMIVFNENSNQSNQIRFLLLFFANNKKIL